MSDNATLILFLGIIVGGAVLSELIDAWRNRKD